MANDRKTKLQTMLLNMGRLLESAHTLDEVLTDAEMGECQRLLKDLRRAESRLSNFMHQTQGV